MHRYAVMQPEPLTDSLVHCRAIMQLTTRGCPKSAQFEPKIYDWVHFLGVCLAREKNPLCSS